MLRQRPLSAARLPAGRAEADDERGVDHPRHLLEQIVAGGAEDREVKAHVGLDERVHVWRLGPDERGGHVANRRLERGERRRIRAHRGKRSGTRFDHGAHFRQFCQKHRPGHAVVLPGHDVGVEQIPGFARRNPRADLGLGFDESLRGQNPNRFPQRGPAGRQRGTCVKRITGTDVPTQNTASERVHDLAVQVGVWITSRNRSHCRLNAVRAARI